MAKQLKAFRLNERDVNAINNYPHSVRGDVDLTTKIEEIIHATYCMYKCTKMELSGMFTTNECCVFVDITNGFWYTPDMHPMQSLYVNVRDSEFNDNTCSKWKVNVENLLNKIEKLTAYQAHCIFLMCNEFWNMSDELRMSRTIEETIEHIFLI